MHGIDGLKDFDEDADKGSAFESGIIDLYSRSGVNIALDYYYCYPPLSALISAESINIFSSACKS